MYWFAGKMDEKDKVQGEGVSHGLCVYTRLCTLEREKRERSSVGEARPLESAVATRNVKVGTRV